MNGPAIVMTDPTIAIDASTGVEMVVAAVVVLAIAVGFGKCPRGLHAGGKS